MSVNGDLPNRLKFRPKKFGGHTTKTADRSFFFSKNYTIFVVIFNQHNFYNEMTVIIKWKTKHDKRLAKLINRYRDDSVVKETISKNLPGFHKYDDISPSLLKYAYEPDDKENTLFEMEAYHKIQKLTNGIEQGFAPPTNALVNNFKIIICLLFIKTSLNPLLQQVKIDGKFPFPMMIRDAIASGTTMIGLWIFQPDDNDLLLPLSYVELFQVLIGPCMVSISYAFFLISFGNICLGNNTCAFCKIFLNHF